MLGIIKRPLKSVQFLHNNMPQMSQVEGACNWHADCKNVHQSCCQKLNVNFTTISRLQRCFREFGSTSNRPHNRRPRVWRRVGKQFADVNVVNRVPHCWWWGYGMVRHKRRTTKTIAFYRWQFECTEIQWWDPEAHCPAIHPPPSPHVSSW